MSTLQAMVADGTNKAALPDVDWSRAADMVS